MKIEKQIPRQWYFDEELFYLENENLLGRSWSYVCRKEELSTVGSYVTAQLGKEQVLVLRKKDMTLAAFHNVCPHRGARILEGKGICDKLKCPYHAWIFDENGDTHHVPKSSWFGPCTDFTELKLRSAAVKVWKGFIFVNPSTECEEFEEWIGDYGEYLDGCQIDYEELEEVSRFTFDEQINWKLIVENYVEDYHFAYVHPKTLAAFDFSRVRTLPTKNHIRIPMPYKRTPPVGHSKYPWQHGSVSRQGFIFPTLTLQPATNHLSLFIIKPISANRSVIEIPVYQTPQQRINYPIDLALLKRDIENDMEEDFAICRALQINTQSSHYSVNVLAGEHELGVKHFHETWRSFMSPFLT